MDVWAIPWRWHCRAARNGPRHTVTVWRRRCRAAPIARRRRRAVRVWPQCRAVGSWFIWLRTCRAIIPRLSRLRSVWLRTCRTVIPRLSRFRTVWLWACRSVVPRLSWLRSVWLRTRRTVAASRGCRTLGVVTLWVATTRLRHGNWRHGKGNRQHCHGQYVP